LRVPIWFRWLGVAGIELRVGEQVLVIDPFFTRPPFWRLWFGRVSPDHDLVREKVPRCDYVLVTHAHFDHLMDVPDVVLNTGALALGSPNTCRLLVACGVAEDRVRQIGVGDALELGAFRVEVLPAEHIRVPGFAAGPLPSNPQPQRLRDYRMDECYSFLIEVEGLRLLDWRSVKAEPSAPADVLFVGSEMARAQYELLLPAVRPRLVIPVHWDDLFRPLTKPIRPWFEPPRLAFPPLRRVNLDAFGRTVKRITPRARVLVPGIFRTYDLRAE
jgi:L-ascorbate metabolism protein UlaG (beta-lactamase superfamily)